MKVHASDGRELSFAAVLSSAWTFRERRIRLFVNHTAEPQEVTYKGRRMVIPALSGEIVPI